MAGNDWLYDFVTDGTISDDQLQEALAIAKRRGRQPEDVLIEMGYIDADVVASKKAQAFGMGTVDLGNMEIPHTLIELVPESVARENTCIPVEMQGERMIVAVVDAMNLELLDKLRFILNRDVDLTTASKESILAAINRHYGQSEGESVDSMIMEFTETAIDFTETEMSDAASALKDEERSPIVKLVNLIFNEAVNMRASDIHIEPFEDRIRIRYRIDGHLVERDSPPRRLLAALTSRIKVMGRMDIAEKRRPQDGRVKTRAGGKEIDLRVSILPTNHGQALVMRILDRDNIKVGIRNLGFSEENYRRFHNVIRRPNGIFLVTGPTGSGKTTTLYSALGELNRPDRKIITAEDPVEYYLPGINQVEVKHNIGLDFQRIIRAMLRQAPNVILVGEIRDTETGEMAIQASLTGHLVFSTLHTNDAPGAITRLIDMGVQPFLVASSLTAVMAQRLMRTVCPKCGEPTQPDPSELAFFELTPEQVANATFRRGKGCKHCQHTGMRGRKAVFELMMVNAAIRDLAFRSEPAQNIRRTARLYGMKTLVEDAVDKALEGISTLAEAYKLRSGGH
ncbi:GspE/PulE family protein [Planctomicrobium piriforme]|uniref:Type IV pilus assembly protein PilB n=1 Tax=Planctomicrobium piriforme TaxID=1576369 RepID=A0A1I3S0C8_9PLAN|nr:GspE/PulE family protein [Planctomicrobium piriforme]SFJ50997.1 type IV pilus assembly protein PilB [Planctomicrobium piriforme]